MTEHVPVAIVLSLALVAQASATVMAVRLTRVAGRQLAWLLIAAALLLMTVRRLVPLVRLLGGSDATLDPANEIVGLVLSVLMAAGVARMGPILAERQQVKGALEERERQMDRLIDESSVAMVVSAGPEARVQLVNRRFTELFGYSAVDIPDEAHWWPLAYPDGSVRQHTLAQWAARVDRAAKSGAAVEPMETTVQCKDGSQRHVEFRLSLVGDRRLITVIDLTARKREADEHAAYLRFAEGVDQVNRAIQGSDELEAMLSGVLEAALSIFECDRAFFAFPCDPEAPSWRVAMERARGEHPAVSVQASELSMDEEIARMLRALLVASGPLKLGSETEPPLPTSVAQRLGTRSMMSIAIRPKVGKPWQLALHDCSRARGWAPCEEQLLDALGQRIADALSTLLVHRQLKESETLYRSLVSSMAEGVVLQMADGTVTSVNPAAERIVGWSAREMLGRTSDDPRWEGAVREDGSPLEAQLQPSVVTLHTGTPQSNFVMGVHRPDGALAWITVNSQPLLAPGSTKPYAVVSSFHDITASKAAEEALHRREEEFRALVENSPDFISRHDRDGRMVYCNPSVSRLLCFAGRGVLGKTALELLPGSHTGQIFHDAVMGVLETGRPAETEFVLHGLRTERVPVHHARFVAELDRAGKVTSVLAVGRDITERKLAEAELLRYREHLEELVSERTTALEAANRELESFSYSMSHDLRTPLRAIDGFSRSLATSHALATDEAAQRLIRVVRKNTAKLSRLIDDMLAFFRSGRIELRLVEVDMAQLARDVWRALNADGEDQPPRLDLGPLPPARGDPVMLRQLWFNLLSNAIKFTRPVASAHIEVGGSRSGEECAYYVKDNGVGFDPAYKHKLFGVFQRLHGVEEYEGTGIGLAIVKRIVTRHGGRVDAEGEVGKGVTIRFTLPGG